MQQQLARALDAVGWVLVAVSLALIGQQLRWPIASFDEGVVLTDAWLVLHGDVPYRDFYANYPPGVSLLVAALWSVFGESIAVERWLGVCIHVTLALCAGRLAGRVESRSFSPLAAGAVLLAWRLAPLYPFAWSAALCALFAALVAIERARELGRGHAWFGAGLALGLVGVFRHDVFVWSVLALSLAAFAARGRAGRVARLPFACGVLLPLAWVWGLVLAQSGWRAPLEDLVLRAARVVWTERDLPLPSLWPLGFPGAAVVLVLGGPLFALACWKRGARATATVLLGAASLVVLPQALGRSDLPHLLDALPPGLALSVALFAREIATSTTWPRRAIPIALLAMIVAAPLPRLRWTYSGGYGAPLASPRAQSLPEREPARAAARNALLACIARETRVDDPIWIGTTRHDAIESNELDLYFLAARRPASRLHQFDPGLTDTDEAQRAIRSEFEARPPTLVVLCECCGAREPTGGRSRILDEHLEEHYETFERFGPYRVLRQRR